MPKGCRIYLLLRSINLGLANLLYINGVMTISYINSSIDRGLVMSIIDNMLRASSDCPESEQSDSNQQTSLEMSLIKKATDQRESELPDALSLLYGVEDKLQTT